MSNSDKSQWFKNPRINFTIVVGLLPIILMLITRQIVHEPSITTSILLLVMLTSLMVNAHAFVNNLLAEIKK